MAKPTTTVSLEQALRELVAPFLDRDADARAASEASKAVFAKLTKDKEQKTALAPLASMFKHRPDGERVMQRCLEMPGEEALHRAAASLLGEWGRPVLVSIAETPQPKRSIAALAVSPDGKLVYALERYVPVVSLWSTESGAHVEDWKVAPEELAAVKKRAAGQPIMTSIAVPADGTVRVVTWRGGAVYERGPKAKAFENVLAFGQLNGLATSGRWLAGGASVESEGEDVPAHIHLRVFDLDTRKLCHDVELRGDHVDDVAIDGDAYVVIATKYDHEDGDARAQLDVLSLRDGSRKTLDLPKDAEVSGLAAHEGRITMKVYLDGDWADRQLDPVTLKLTPAERVDPDAKRWPDGRIGNGLTLADAAGKELASYTIFEDHNQLTTEVDTVNGRLLIAGANLGTLPVIMVEPYGARSASKKPSAKVAPTPLDWAKPGTVLRYAIADFDAEDEYAFEVLEAEPDLALRVTMGKSEVAPRLVFTKAALDGAKKHVTLAQGGLDVDADEPQKSALPPFLLSRAASKKLRAGGALRFSSAYTDDDTLTAHPAPARVTFDGEEKVVAAHEANGESVHLVMHDDEAFPLLIERVEGDCFVRLVSVDRRTSDTKATPAAKESAEKKGSKEKATAKSAAAPKTPGKEGPARAEKRRFELVDGSSSKFWEIEDAGNEFRVTFGKIGTSGQSQVKTFDSVELAHKEAEKLVREKTKKGYLEVFD